MEQTPQQPLFPLGQVVTTPAALAAIAKAGQGPPEFLARHANGDWGDLWRKKRKRDRLKLPEYPSSVQCRRFVVVLWNVLQTGDHDDHAASRKP